MLSNLLVYEGLVIFTYASKSRSVFICTYTILRLDEEEGIRISRNIDT